MPASKSSALAGPWARRVWLRGVPGALILAGLACSLYILAGHGARGPRFSAKAGSLEEKGDSLPAHRSSGVDLRVQSKWSSRSVCRARRRHKPRAKSAKAIHRAARPHRCPCRGHAPLLTDYNTRRAWQGTPAPPPPPPPKIDCVGQCGAYGRCSKVGRPPLAGPHGPRAALKTSRALPLFEGLRRRPQVARLHGPPRLRSTSVNRAQG